MKCNTRRAKEEMVISAYQTIGKTIIAYLDASAGCVVTDLCGFKRKRLQAMYDTTQDTISYLMARYGEGSEDCRERADHAVFYTQRQLRECAGFDFPEMTEAMKPQDDFGRTWHSPADISKHKTRMIFVADMELVVQTYHATILYWFWQTYGYAHDRLTRLYRLLREDYNLWVTEYLRCSSAGDRAAQELLTKRQDRMQDIGMEFEEV